MDYICPRCRLSTLEFAGASRATDGRDIEVCGPCSSDEAWIAHYGIPVQKMAAWPVALTYDDLGQRAWA